jgi:hypothetical protein
LDRVVFTSTALGRPGDADAPGFSGSTEVLYALMRLMRRDYRSGLRQMLSGSAGFDEDVERDRAEVLAGSSPKRRRSATSRPGSAPGPWMSRGDSAVA